MKYYLIGIKGAALSALAKLLVKDGHIVRGVDVEDDFYTCQNMDGINIDNFNNVILKRDYYYVIGNAYVEHDLVKLIKQKGFYYKLYPQFLYHYYKYKKWICISGSHGKTTTTKMVSSILDNCIGLIGNGEFNYGNGEYFILEACEYRNTFLNYLPYIALVLNVDYDHPDFFKSREEYVSSFIRFINNSKIAIVNGDELFIDKDNIITYGLNNHNDVQFKYEYKDGESIVYILNKPFYLPVVGLHYAYDFVGAYLICKLLNIKDIDIQKKLLSFKMPKRRMDTTIIDSQIVICDYAHHPTELMALYESIKLKYNDMMIIIVFEPHTISRLEAYLEDYKKALDSYDQCYLFNLFTSVREKRQNKKEKEVYDNLRYQRYNLEIKNKLRDIKNAVICFVGAGRIDEEYRDYIK